MKKLLILIVLTNFSIRGLTQNLVPNPSFEDTIACPYNFSQLHFAPPWYTPSIGTPDLFHVCSTGNYPFGPGVPRNGFGAANPLDGAAYSVILCYDDYYTSNREYIAVPLTAPLDSNCEYCVSFYASLTDSSRCTVESIQAALTPDSLTVSIGYIILYPAQVSSENKYISIKNGWGKVYGTYLAVGGEAYLTIGNFQLNAQTNVQYLSSDTSIVRAASYYIDDVSVAKGKCPLTREFLKNVYDSTLYHPSEPNDTNIVSYDYFTLFPNPSTGYFIIQGNFSANSFLHIYNLLGQEVLEPISLTEGNRRIPFSLFLADGLYIYTIQSPVGLLHSGRLLITR
jgi:hypothetical protein